jgi:dienelactone hydrolase
MLLWIGYLLMMGMVWGAEADYWKMGPWKVERYVEERFGHSVAYYPRGLGGDELPKAPVVFFLPGWGSVESSDYDRILRFIASHGYVAIYAQDRQAYDTRHFRRYLREMVDRDDVAPYLDRRRFGVVGHSSGGGSTFAILRYFSRKGWGNGGRFLMALDPWFAFDLTTKQMQKLPSNTRVILQRYTHADHPNETDLRIPLSEYALLGSIPKRRKDYQLLQGTTHGYPAGDRSARKMKKVLQPLGALMACTFEKDLDACRTALDRGTDDPFHAGEPLRPRSEYLYRCDSHANRAEILEIDYCGAFRGPKPYPKEEAFEAVPTDRSVEAPGYRESIDDPAFGSRVIRITDRKRQTANAHPYPKTQAFSSDGRLLRLGYRIYDARSFRQIEATRRELIDGAMTEMKWSTVRPRVFYGLRDRDGTVAFVEATVGKRRIRYRTLVRFDKSEYEELRIGPWEGNIDFLDRKVVFAARRVGEEHLTAILYSLEENRTRIAELEDIPWSRLDWISISPKGDWVLVNWEADPDNPDPDAVSQVWQYDENLEFVRVLARQGNHGDMGLDAHGREVYVQFEFGDERGIWRYDLADGARRKLLPDKYNGGHLSCRNYKRPGWCYLSPYKEGFREVVAVNLDRYGRVERFVQTHIDGVYSLGGVSPDGTRVIFQSDWGGGAVDTYLAEMP